MRNEEVFFFICFVLLQFHILFDLPWLTGLHWAPIPQASWQESLHLKLKHAWLVVHSASFSHSPARIFFKKRIKYQSKGFLFQFLHEFVYSLIFIRPIYYFDTWAIIRHGIVCWFMVFPCFYQFLFVAIIKLFCTDMKIKTKTI